MHCIEVHTAAREQLLQRTALGWSFRMKGKIDPLNVDLEILSQLFNTPGTEIAPGSDEVGEDLQLDRFICHLMSMAQDWKFSVKQCAVRRYPKPFSNA